MSSPRRLWCATVALVAAVAVAGCGSSGATVGARIAAPTDGTLQQLLSRLSGPVAVSPVIKDGDGHAVAVAMMKQLSRPAMPEVLVYHLEGTAWTQTADVVLDVGGSVAADNGVTTPITTADLTPASEPDLLVTVHYNAGPVTAVLSKYGGHWHALTFAGGIAPAGDERFDVHLRGRAVSSRENDCVPSCAQGHLVTRVFRFDPSTGRLEAGR